MFARDRGLINNCTYMSFRDFNFNENGPGTVEWDIVMGHNTATNSKSH